MLCAYKDSSTSIKTEAVIRHLHGTTLLKHNITIGAKKEFIKALELDVKCFDVKPHFAVKSLY